MSAYLTHSVFEKQPSLDKINCTLAVLSPRKIDSAHCIRYKNKFYIPVSDKGIPYYLKNKTDCMVIEAFDGRLYVNVLDELFIMKEIPAREKYSKEFDHEVKEKKPKKQYIPPMDHPWRNSNFLGFLSKQKHRSNGANV